MSEYQFDTYPKYRKCDLRWLSSVPSEWQTVPIKYLVKFFGGGTPSKDVTSYWGGNIPWVSPKDMKSKVINNSQDRITEAGLHNSTSNLIASGSLLMVVRSGILQHTIPVAINSVEVSLNQDMKALRSRGRLHIPFAFYVVQGNNDLLLLEWSKQGATVESIEQEYLANCGFPVPPIKEQQKIAIFLDHETAKIDTLIEKQQQLIKLLKEKRQAVISHAVTKGLNPDAPMRDSGVEWLGEVPEGWIVLNIKYAIKGIGDVDHLMPSSVEEGIPYLMTGDLEELVSDISFSKCKKVTKNDFDRLSQKIKSEKGDVIVARYATIGTTCYVDIEKDFLVSYSCVTIKPCSQKIYGLYIYYYFKTHEFLKGIQNQVNTNTQSNVGIQDLRNFKIPLPNLDEQKIIVEHLESRLNKLDYISSKSEKIIKIMQERRTTLISAAVTGKIDVRNWQPPKSVNKELSKDAQHA